jgi:SAM-dependent methyltransferase
MAAGTVDATTLERMDPASTDSLAGSAWTAPGTVAGFVKSPPNPELIRYARIQQQRGARRVLDIGCGAGRNAAPLSELGLQVIGVDLSAPMLTAAAARAPRVQLMMAPMRSLPVRSRSIDLLVAHGIWNLARSRGEFHRALAEAARVAAPGAALFVFTFSRHTLEPGARPLAGQGFVFTQFSGSPQVFLTDEQLIDELGAVGFEPDPDLPLRELNRPAPGQIRSGGAPVIYEGGFRFSRGNTHV